MWVCWEDALLQEFIQEPRLMQPDILILSFLGHLESGSHTRQVEAKSLEKETEGQNHSSIAPSLKVAQSTSHDQLLYSQDDQNICDSEGDTFENKKGFFINN